MTWLRQIPGVREIVDADGETLPRSNDMAAGAGILATYDVATRRNVIAVDPAFATSIANPTVRLAATGNINLAPEALLSPTVDGETVVTGDRIFLPLQTDPIENGPYVATVSEGGMSLARATDFAAGASVVPGLTIAVQEGATWRDTTWTLQGAGTLTVGTDALAWRSDAREIDVRRFGVVANGIADDTAAVVAAKAALGATGGVLVFPIGTTMVDPEVLNFDGPADGVSSVTLRGVARGVGQYGSGSVIKARGAGAYLVRFAGQNMRSEHLTLHGGSETEGGAAVDTVVFFDYQSIGSGLLDCTVRGGRNTAPITVTPDHTTETFTAIAHGLADGAQLYLTTTSGLPAGLYNVAGHYNRVWFVINRTDDTFQISATNGGAAQAFTDNGAGTISATEIGGHDWGHLVRVGGVSGIQADTGFITNCIIGELNRLVGRSVFFSDGNALVWRITNCNIFGGIDTIYNRGGSFVLSSVNLYPKPVVSRSHIVKDGACGTVSIGGASYSEADAVPFIVCLPGGTDYSPGWAIHDMQFATGRAHVHWDCCQPLLMQQMGGSLFVTASGSHFVSCVGTSTDYAADAELGRIYGDTSKVVRFGHRERGEGPQTVVRRLSGVPGVPGGNARHGQGLFLDGGAPEDDSLRMHGPLVVDLGKYGSGNQTAGLVLGRRLASVNVDSVDHTVDRITKAAHGLGFGESVRFATTGTLPGGLLTSLDYWVKPVSSDVFEVALERNGDTVPLTNNGTGTLSFSALQELLHVCQDSNTERGHEVRFTSPLPVEFFTPTLAARAEISIEGGTSYTLSDPPDSSSFSTIDATPHDTAIVTVPTDKYGHYDITVWVSGVVPTSGASALFCRRLVVEVAEDGSCTSLIDKAIDDQPDGITVGGLAITYAGTPANIIATVTGKIATAIEWSLKADVLTHLVGA